MHPKKLIVLLALLALMTGCNKGGPAENKGGPAEASGPKERTLADFAGEWEGKWRGKKCGLRIRPDGTGVGSYEGPGSVVAQQIGGITRKEGEYTLSSFIEAEAGEGKRSWKLTLGDN